MGSTVEIAKKLFQKQSLIDSEKQTLHKLTEELSTTSESLFQLNWISGKQKLNVDQLIACGPDQNPGLHCLQAITLDNVVFKHANKKLSSLCDEFGQLLMALRKRPEFVAQLLIEAEQNNVPNLATIIPVIMSTLFADCLLPEDQNLVLLLLKELLNHQITVSEHDPRRLLRQGSSTFYRVYKVFIENLRSAKLFLISALGESILSVLIEDESYLEIDPDNPTFKFTPQSRPRHPINESNLMQRDQTVNKLTNLVVKFIEGINHSIKCFPDDLCWLIRHLHFLLTSRFKSLSSTNCEATIICSELIFAHFICHAIVNPEQYGIVNTYISDVARFNLMQIAQIIQALVMNQKDLLESKYKDLCSKISPDCVSSTLKLIFQDSSASSFSPSSSSISMVCDISRSSALITEHDLDIFVAFLMKINSSSTNQSITSLLSQMLSKIPQTYYTVLGRKDLYSMSKNHVGSSDDINLSESTKVKRGLLRRVTRRKQDVDNFTNSSSNSTSPSSTSNFSEENNGKLKNISDTLLTEVLIFNFPNCDKNLTFMESVREQENGFRNSSYGSFTNKISEKLIDLSDDTSEDTNNDKENHNNNTHRKSAKVLSKIFSSVDINSCNLPLDRLQNNNEDTFSKLECILKVILAEKILIDDQFNIIAIQEAIRHIKLWNKETLPKLIFYLEEDRQNMSSFIDILLEHEQRVLSNLSLVKSLTSQLLQDRHICNHMIVSQCVRFYMLHIDKELERFISDSQKLVAFDEKASTVEKFLQSLFTDMETDKLWQIVTDEQFEYGKKLIERFVMGQIYPIALYPNGDGDIFRDQILQKHIQTLSETISPEHKDLKIPSVYHFQCPWTSVQRQILSLNAYKTPREKVNCVVKCCKMIMNLLSLAHDKSVPSADDMIPVLVFILIKANPSWLLSNVQYVNCYYDRHLTGEQAYWWTQFSSAVEFVKTMG